MTNIVFSQFEKFALTNLIMWYSIRTKLVKRGFDLIYSGSNKNSLSLLLGLHFCRRIFLFVTQGPSLTTLKRIFSMNFFLCFKKSAKKKACRPTLIYQFCRRVFLSVSQGPPLSSLKRVFHQASSDKVWYFIYRVFFHWASP